MGTYENVNASFKSLTKAMFGSGIGELIEFEPWLKETLLAHRIVDSHISGKKVFIAGGLHPKGAKFISQDEMGLLGSAPLDINEIKDVDSLFSAINERAIYCGNKQFGRNLNVEMADNCVESTNILYCHNNYHVKNAAYCSQVREAEAIFGVTTFPLVRSSIRCIEGMNLVRGFETHYTTNSSDMYYCFNCSGCSNSLFSFNQRSKSSIIGNLALPKDRFLSLKQKLVAEMAEELRKNKRIFSILDIALAGCKSGNAEPEIPVAYGAVPPRVEKAFGSTTAVILGKEQKGIRKFEKWLTRHALPISKVKGAFGTPTYKVGLPLLGKIPAERLASSKEALKSGEDGIEINEGETPSLKEIVEMVAPKAYFTFEFSEGHSEEVVDVTAIFNANNVYAFWDATDSSLSAYASAVIKSKLIFGGSVRMLQSNSCINCYDSTDLNRCFEVDSSYTTNDSYFCHNCENVSDSMFCFNAKNLRYAVGNVVVGREEYVRVKKLLLDYVNRGLELDQGIAQDVFSIGAGTEGK